MLTHYEILGIESSATESEIARAYRQLALRWHPDKNPDNTEEAEKIFKLIGLAYETLREPESRRQYDAHLESQKQYDVNLESQKIIELSQKLKENMQKNTEELRGLIKQLGLFARESRRMDRQVLREMRQAPSCVLL